MVTYLDRAQATADRVLARYGIKKNNGILRRNTGDRPCTVVLLNYSAEERAGSLIQHGDQKAMVSAFGLSVPPDNELDSLVIVKSGSVFKIVAPPGKLDPTDDVVVFWELQVRA